MSSILFIISNDYVLEKASNKLIAKLVTYRPNLEEILTHLE